MHVLVAGKYLPKKNTSVTWDEGFFQASWKRSNAFSGSTTSFTTTRKKTFVFKQKWYKLFITWESIFLKICFTKCSVRALLEHF